MGSLALPIPVFVLLAYNAVVLLGGAPAVTLPAVVLGARRLRGGVHPHDR